MVTGPSKPRPKVLCAMSGGVDSSVAAALLIDAGYDVVGCFMRLGGSDETEGLTAQSCPAPAAGSRALPQVRPHKQGCCSVNDAADARLVAAHLGIPFYVCNFRREFGRIMDYFADEYLAGRTPNPCVRCNDWLKFGRLHDYAGQIGAQFIASGHYARVENGQLLRGVDHAKDQSYVLFGMPRAQLAHTLLPIGAMRKPAVRDTARRLGLPVFNKPDSQEICFVPGQDYAAFVESRRPGAATPGDIRDESGRTLGRHAGQHRFTIGQRKGLGVALGRAAFVVDRDARTNTVTLGATASLLATSCSAGEANWLVDPPPTAGHRILARVRSNSQPVAATLHPLPDAPPGPSGRAGAFKVVFESPVAAVAPGQAVVLYDAARPDLVLGGGWVISASRQ